MGLKMKVTIFNDSFHVLKVHEGNAPVFRNLVATIHPVSQDGNSWICEVDPKAIYHEFSFSANSLSAGGCVLIISVDEFIVSEEIRIYATSDNEIRFCISKPRGLSEQASSFVKRNSALQDWYAFEAVKKDASDRMEAVERLRINLEKLLKQVTICLVQCKYLVRTYSRGIQDMKETYYFLVYEDFSYVWRLYESKKLRQLNSSLDSLMRSMMSAEKLLQACGRNEWRRVALVASIPPSEVKTYSKFALLIREFRWNLDMIHYALHLAGGPLSNKSGHLQSSEDLEFYWCEERCRFVLGRYATRDRVAEVESLAADVDRQARDRMDVLSHLEEPSPLTLEKYFLSLARQLLNRFAMWLTWYKSATDRSGDKFAGVVKKRLQEISGSPKPSSVPDCFWIDYLDLKTDKLLTRGSFKSIYQGEWLEQAVAIAKIKPTTREMLEREAGFLVKLQHPNIVDFFGCALKEHVHDGASVLHGKKRTGTGYLVMELMQQDLRCVLDRKVKRDSGDPFPLPVTVDILLQIVEAMLHLHQLKVIHRDLKAANCLVSPRYAQKSISQGLDPVYYNVKLIDFGISRILDPSNVLLTCDMGTRPWMAPEVWGVDGLGAEYTGSADVYSFGMTCYEVITGSRPFENVGSARELRLMLKDGKRPLVPVSCPQGLKEVMTKCWAQEPTDRPQFETIRKELWTIKYHVELQIQT